MREVPALLSGKCEHGTKTLDNDGFQTRVIRNKTIKAVISRQKETTTILVSFKKKLANQRK